MILADTSIWIEAFRDADSPAAAAMGRLLDEDRIALAAPVRIELLAGAPNRQASGLRRLLSALPCWYPDRDDWRRIEEWIERALRVGHRFGFADLLIAALAWRHSARLWSRDRDFERMATLGWLQLYRE